MAGEREKTYWLQVFNATTWFEFLHTGGRVTGFRPTRWRYIQQLRPGDILVCYLSGLSKFIGLLEVLSEPYLDNTPIWEKELFPCRAEVKLMASLPLEQAIPISTFMNELTILHGKHWGLHFVNSPSRWKVVDGAKVETAILAARG